MNSNLPRWIKTSVFKEFTTELNSYNIYIEGMKRSTYSKTSFIELRVSNPSRHVLSANVVRYTVSINLLVYHTGFENLYDLSDMVGVCIKAFRRSIIIRETDSPFTPVGCLTLIENVRGRESVQVNDYGIVDRDLNIQQSTVEAQYEIILEN